MKDILDAAVKANETYAMHTFTYGADVCATCGRTMQDILNNRLTYCDRGVKPGKAKGPLDWGLT